MTTRVAVALARALGGTGGGQPDANARRALDDAGGELDQAQAQRGELGPRQG